MFSKHSRYRRLPDVVTTDAQGRTAAAKALRLPPQVESVFRHTIEAADRLDHLAFKYYQQPHKWWRISDANPAFLSPQALLGHEPIVTYRFPLRLNGDDAASPLSTLVRELLGRVGVEDVKIEETVQAERLEQAVVVMLNRLNITAHDLAQHMVDLGFTVSQPERMGQVGKQITIPPNIVG
jgi:hypothetical protein